MEKRKRRRWQAVLLALLLAVTTGICPIIPAESSGSVAEAAETKEVKVTAKAMYGYAYQVLDLVNQERKKAGLSTLTMDLDLLEAAMQRSAECVAMMAISGGLSHTRPNEEECFKVSDKTYAENIACGQRSPSEVVTAWMNSKMGHRENILGSGYVSIGVGCVEVDDIMVLYWAQEFGYDSARTGAKPADAEREFTVEVTPENYEAALSSTGYGDIIRDTATGTWKHDKNGWWYRNADGTYPSSAWMKDSGSWYYFGADGYMVTGWNKIGTKWYFFRSNGKMATGWKQSDGKWYFLASNGAMVTGWRKIGGYWYHFKGGGDMRTGWYKYNGSWYYFKNDGTMATGTLKIGPVTYKFSSEGICLNP